jgi:hypothetical protein
MSDLLELAVAAHGGLARWNELKTVHAQVSLGGVIWALKGKENALRDVTIEADLHEERLTTYLTRQGRRTTFQPQRVLLQTEGALNDDAFDDPRETFRDHKLTTPWNDMQLAYFSSYALWNYLTIPFLYTYPGFSVEELPPWEEEGEIWRPLRVQFPDYIATHSREQTSYFGPDGLLRRHQYNVDILEGAPGVNYALDYKDADGIVVPTTRRVYAFDDQGRPVPEPLLVSIDIKQIAFA